ncbi:MULTISPECIES: 1,2-dihydroxy-3-keto-5-methylthiopentene dioxygenase [unclassified Pseudomonas]|uniref:1,2-dihydroxy-3-keto-5-methylthiopentene dioxygenase n=1 Tax=unclassified Pseudomonas TaxID=196821 RepID=UPI0025E8AEEB|nr:MULTISPECIES: acireductone dioxygenase [unclassified Pseudomonas]
MSILFVYHVSSAQLPTKVLTHFEDIASTLAEQGIGFERMSAVVPVTAGAPHDEVLSAYREQLDGLMTERGHVAADVISVDAHHPHKDPLRGELLDEHQYGADQVRFFVAGRALYSLHIGDFIYAVQCEKNDLISVPAGTRQWFDIGEHPRVIAIRLFSSAEGQAPQPTGESFASRFPGLDD